MSETNNRHLSAAERWDNCNSAASDPIHDLREAVGLTDATQITIPRRAWAAFWAHPVTVQAHMAIIAKYPPELQPPWYAPKPRVTATIAEHMIGLSAGGLVLVEEDGPVVIGEYELRGVVEAT